MNDTAFAGDSVQPEATGGLDAIYDQVYDNLDAANEAEHKQSNQPIRSFSNYVVEFLAGKGAFQSEDTMPVLRIPVKILEGPEGTVGEVAFLTRFLSVSPQKSVKRGNERVKEDRTPDEMTAAIKEWQEVQQRIAKRLGLTQVAPARPISEQSIEVYGAQFTGKRATIEIRLEKEQGPYPARNGAQWQSIRALDDEVFDKATGKKLGTALEVAKAEIEKANQRASQSKRGSTARQFKGSAPSQF